jgi:hypothetical protein
LARFAISSEMQFRVLIVPGAGPDRFQVRVENLFFLREISLQAVLCQQAKCIASSSAMG